MKKQKIRIIMSIVVMGVLCASLSVHASNVVPCPSLDQFDTSQFTMRDVHYSGPSDNPSEYPYSWSGYFQQKIEGQGSWYLGMGYVIQQAPNKREAYTELKALYPDLPNQKPSVADDNGVCIYRLSENGTTGYAANYVIGCQAGALCSSEMSQLSVSQ